MVEEKERKSVSNVGMLDSGKSYKRQLPEVVRTIINSMKSSLGSTFTPNSWE